MTFQQRCPEAWTSWTRGHRGHREPLFPRCRPSGERTSGNLLTGNIDYLYKYPSPHTSDSVQVMSTMSTMSTLLGEQQLTGYRRCVP